MITKLNHLHKLPEPTSEIYVNKMPLPFELVWSTPIPTLISDTLCSGYTDVLNTPTQCSKMIPLTSTSIWLFDFDHGNVYCYFCCGKCVVFFLKNKYALNYKLHLNLHLKLHLNLELRLEFHEFLLKLRLDLLKLHLNLFKIYLNHYIIPKHHLNLYKTHSNHQISMNFFLQ